MTKHLENRDCVLKALREELVGPSPAGTIVDCSQQLLFESEEEFYAPHRQGDGEEILDKPPARRYGAGILFPWKTSGDAEEDLPTEEEAEEAQESGNLLSEKARKKMEEIENRQVPRLEWAEDTDKLEAEEDEFELSDTNSYRPSSLGVSLRCELPEGSKLVVLAKGGRYRRQEARLRNMAPRDWWLRYKVELVAELTAEVLTSSDKTEFLRATVVDSTNLDDLDLRVEVISRPHQEGERLLTICLVNRTASTSSYPDEFCLFQAGFEVRIVSDEGNYLILPYPEGKMEPESLDDEEKSIALLYRNMKTYAVGHGCAADWGKEKINDRIDVVKAEVMPTYETPSITPDIRRSDDTILSVSMVRLAGWEQGRDGIADLEEVIALYSQWIKEREVESQSLTGVLRDAAEKNLEECRLAEIRMREGLRWLQSDDRAMLAFRLTNQAMLMQQVSSLQEPRDGWFDEDGIQFSTPFREPDFRHPEKNRGKWRAFQIAFLLMSLRSAVLEDDADRERVDLIWFPTGGGKTEAYLGLAAFAMFFRRLMNPEDNGVHILMRYTLRLLTAQQFQRSSKLICSMELLRSQQADKLGGEPFSIGIWLGGSTTPNTRDKARSALGKLETGETESAPFVLRHCPWCGAKFGEYSDRTKDKSARKSNTGKRKKVSRNIFGYVRSGGTVRLECPDASCHFSEGLPVYVIDEDVYEYKPTFVIGTVDKFAMLAWNPKARTLFGRDEAGKQIEAPPGLIIQDELHLISGPLGSLAGLYETVIEELCVDRRNGRALRPKLVCSTATIRRYRKQIEHLYARKLVSLFPAPGLDASDSFFSQYAKERDEAGQWKLSPGRRYVGINTPALGSLLTTEVRAFSAVLQAPVRLPEDERDPWWTLLVFFNSLRELGTGLTLFQSDIPDYLGSLKRRYGLNWSQMRRIDEPSELTSRLSSDDVTKAIDDLKVPADQKGVIDICLASNIIEVGIDIDRLSLMAVVGQPKTTSQYIQVTGRVGRKFGCPGLVMMLYAASKPRDRSHFERFRTYHERLYAEVEPTSVTPFSPPVLDRALHALMVAYVRQVGDKRETQHPYPFPEEVLNELKRIVLERVRVVDPLEEKHVREVFDLRMKEWKHWTPQLWQREKGNQNLPLLRAAGAYATRREERVSWSTPMSMRNVDAQCEGEILDYYAHTESE